MADITVYKPAGVTVNVKSGGPANTISVQKPAALTIEVLDNPTTPPPPNPTIAGFAATPATINAGQSSSLNATITNASTLKLDGVVIPSLPQVVAPTATRTYTLTATGASGTTPASAQTTVTVMQVAPPPNPTISGFTATPSTVNAGQQATLNATVTNAQSLTLDGVVTTLPKVVTPSATHTYELKATGVTGTTPATAQTTVTVTTGVPIPPEPTPDISRTQIGVQGAALTLVTLVWQYAGGDLYERYQNHTCITTDTIDVLVKSMTNGGPRTFAFARYGIFLSPKQDMTDAVMRSVKDVTADRTTFTITLGSEPDGPYFARVLPIDASNNPVAHGSEKYPVYGLWVDRNGGAKNHTKVIVQNGSFIWAHPVTSQPVYSDVVLLDKVALVPQPLPLPARPDYTAFSTALPYQQVARVPLVMDTDAIDQCRHLPCVTKRGITVTENRQGYTPQLLFADLPINPLLDGPRGVCTAPYSTVLKAGIIGRVYICSPWSLARMESTGEKTTLVGLRHRRGLVPYWEEAPTALPHPALEIVGEWDESISIAERYPLESWFWVWDKRSLKIDPNAPPIDANGQPDPNGLPPHLPYTLPSGEVISGPRGFVSDRRGWVLEVRFSGTNHDAPAKVRKWLTGLLDPWGGDNMETDNTFVVAQRGAHSIDEWSMDAPNTKVRTILKSAGTGAVQTLRGGRTWVGDHNAARALQICAPESVRVRGNVMTFGSLAQEEVRAYDLATNTHLGVVAKPTFAYGGVGSFWLDHDVSDGTCGPAGTIFTTTFTNSNFGHPEAFLPGGAKWNYMSYTYGIDRGRGSWNGGHYPTAVGCGEGRFYGAGSGGGIDYFCMADAYDPVVDFGKAQRGWEDYRKAGLSIVHGPYLVNRNASPVAKGVNADRDYWYAMLGV